MSFSVKGWCPGALRPMASGDGLVVRVRALNGRLTPDQARVIAALARDYGNGLLDVTNRANLQLRGVTERTHPHVLDGLAKLGLLDTDPQAEARRNVMLSPLAAIGGEAWQIAAEIARLMSLPDAPPVPGKFGFAIEAENTPDLMHGTDHDIYLRPDAGWQVYASGCPLFAGGAGTQGRPLDVARMAVDLARWFVDTGGICDGRGRMRAHIARGTVPHASLAHCPGRAPLSPAKAMCVGPADAGFFVGLPFGQMSPRQLDMLADHGTLRLTPWRMLLIEGLRQPPIIPGLITDPADPLLRVVACTGAPRCPQGLADVRALARDLAPRLSADGTLHLSGCAKGCASRQPAGLTLIATGQGRFDLVRHGTPASPRDGAGLTPDQLSLP